MIKKYRAVNIVIIIGIMVSGVVFNMGRVVSASAWRYDFAAPVTTITVDSGTDPTTSKSERCDTHTPCTLRRAIVQARLLAPAQRPVLIQFNIPQSVSEGYDSSLGIWKIHIQSTTDPAVFRYLDGGLVTIDGTTQPGGTTNGPKIFVVGPSTGNKDGLLIGTNAAGGHDGNIIRGLAFQNFRSHIIVNSNNNLIEENWFGLSDDGTEPFLRDDEPEDGSGSSGTALSAGVTGNTIQNNTFLGFDGVAAAIRGDANTFTGNFVGTASDGTTPGKLLNPSYLCTTVDWLGGGGISMEGDDHTISSNTFAGLRQEVFKITTQPDAIRVTGTGHLIQSNKIGVDKNNNKVGVCGRGIFLSDSPKETEVLNNTIVDPGLSGISLNGILYNENTLRTNTIEKTSAWPEVQGNPEPESAIQVGASMTDDFKTFKPAKVTKINGTSINGTSGDSSACPGCIVEVFMDDADTVVEALQSLVVVTALGDGTWSATLPFELSASQGVRTTSTTALYGTIPGMMPGTTTSLSELYTGSFEMFLPLVIR